MDLLNGYRDSTNLSDDDSDDSDKECTVWKRAVRKYDKDENPQKVQEEELTFIPSEKPKRKKNTVWSDILQDQLISEDLSSCLLKNKPAHYGSRGQESYDYTLKYTDPDVHEDLDVNMAEEMPGESEANFNSGHRSFKYGKFVKLDATERAAAQKINKVLNEKKVYLIHRIVKHVGIEKAMVLLNMTEEIEENGGMMTKNNSRRRTPGGVYIQLLKNDKDVTKEIIDKVFEGEMNAIEMKRFYAERKMKKKKFGKKKKITQKSKEGVLLQKTEFEEDKSMEVSELCDEPMSNNGSSFMEKDSTSVPSLTSRKSDSDLEDGEIDE